MKRPISNFDGSLMSICPDSTDEDNLGNDHMYMREFQMEGLDEGEEYGQVSEKKRRLRVDQVRALEKNFEIENKLEPERKEKLAQELGLQPRQVAVWFQNRRARSKTKQLERDYGLLKASFDALKHKYETLQLDNEAFTQEIQELKSKLNEDGETEGKVSSNQEPLASDSQEEIKLESPLNSIHKCNETANHELNYENCVGKDGSSDSDSSAILNEDNSNSPIPMAISSSAGIFRHQFLDIHKNGSSSSMNISLQLSESKAILEDAHKVYQPQFVKIEEHNFYGEESCSTLFDFDQAPTLHWCCSDDWS